MVERIEPGPGQESVWDYPRPPAVVPTDEHVRVVHAGVVVADSRAALRVLETSQPPAYYLPSDDVRVELLARSASTSVCEWKSVATYWDLAIGHDHTPAAAWSYERPTERYASLAGRLAFYPQRVDEAWVDGARVSANPGGFYGGWVTARIVGPFKGGPGTRNW